MNNNDSYAETFESDVIDSKDTRKLLFFLHVVKQILLVIAIAATGTVTGLIILYNLYLFISAGFEILGNLLSLN